VKSMNKNDLNKVVSFEFKYYQFPGALYWGSFFISKHFICLKHGILGGI